VVVRAGVDRRWRVVATAVGLEESGPDQGPVRLALERWPGVPALAGHKSLGRDKWDLARDRAVSNGADDALLVDAGGRVLETSIANIWIRSGERLETPPAPACCLPGVMRRWLIENAPNLGCGFREHELGMDDVAVADEVLISNAVAGFRRVYRVVDRRWSAWPFFDRLRAAGVPAPGWSQASR
jgi:branched-subunit amino acid aminotransferase/4-amino-4-deoxychorismate lyase